ncbi:MAG: hypothetical protein IPP88_18825 [Betaproteobacteria bacterium]|nr:hypothetical protein [Betaproteobacteria bacterium]
MRPFTLAVPSLAPDEMLATIADDLGVDVHGGNTIGSWIRAPQERLIATHACKSRWWR